MVIKLATLFNYSMVDSGWHVLKTGESLAMSANYIVDLFEGLSGVNNISVKAVRRDDFMSIIRLINDQLVDITTSLSISQLSADSIDTSYIPNDLQSGFTLAKDKLMTLKKNFQKMRTVLSLGKEVFTSGNKKYLFIFQNNNEIRATGGFLGSLAVVSFKNGIVTNINVPGGGSYDLQGSLRKNIVSPGPLQLVSSRWEFQDSNWWPDFPTSAKKIVWFYNQSGGVNNKNENLTDRIFGVLENTDFWQRSNFTIDENDQIDGVIAINATFLEELLKLLGPVRIDKYNRVITTNNFVSETQKIVETEYDKTKNKPKEFIGDLMVELTKRVQMLNFVELSEVLISVVNGFKEKDIIMYLSDPALQRVVDSLGWSGRVVNTDPKTDYLYVVHTNIAGGKTDAVMKNSIKHISTVLENGRIINTVEINRLHTGKKGDDFTGIRNVNYIRVYVPLGSTLIEAVGFNKPGDKWFSAIASGASVDYDVAILDGNSKTDLNTGTIIGKQFGKTFFGNWTQTDPGLLSTVRLVYELPFRLDLNNIDQYKMFIQKQPGLRAQDYLSSNLVLPTKNDIIYAQGNNLTLDRSNVSYNKTDNKEDVVWGVVIGR